MVGRAADRIADCIADRAADPSLMLEHIFSLSVEDAVARTVDMH